MCCNKVHVDMASSPWFDGELPQDYYWRLLTVGDGLTEDADHFFISCISDCG